MNQESTITATRHALDEWLRRLPQLWMAGMEATLFTGWIYDHLVSGGAMVKVAHPAMLQAIAAGKKKNDRVDARKIADLLRRPLVSRPLCSSVLANKRAPTLAAPAAVNPFLMKERRIGSTS